jgi:peptide-methionine (S)-S-oxide reductase
MIRSMLFLGLLTFLLSNCNNLTFADAGSPAQTQNAEIKQKGEVKEGLSKAYFASGCFWCVEAIFEHVNGVDEAISGYSGGDTKNPTYEAVSSGTLRHAEAVEVYYDPAVVNFATLVKVFFGSHDPTTPNQQGPDRGPQYRSIAFYQTEEEKEIIQQYISELTKSGAYPNPIVTEVTPFDIFWPAEEYHQDFEKLHPEHPYVRAVSIPRLMRFKEKFPALLKITN